MAAFRFLQLSDLHLGRPFTWLPADKAEVRRSDQRDLLWRAVEVAIERKLEAIVIAGDLFDGEVVDRETIARAIECVSQPGCPPVFIAPGNHDCFSRSTFYYDNRRLAAAGQATWPAHVHVFDAESGARLLEAPQARVDVHVEVLLALLGGLQLVQDHLGLPARARELRAQRLDLAGEVEDHAPLDGGRLDRRQARVDALVARLQLPLQVVHAPAQFRVGEQLRLRGTRPGERRDRDEPRRAHQYSPW